LSATWLVYSTLSSKEMLALEERCTSAIEAYLDENPECEDEWGELGPGGEIPKQAFVASEYRRLRLDLSDEVLERLAKCRSSLAIDHPGDLDLDPLQVSALQYVLERAGEALVSFNDFPLVPGEEALEDLRGREGAPGFGEGEEEPSARGKAGPAKDGEVRAARVISSLETAMQDRDLGVDVQKALTRASELARKYAALLLEEGPLDDATAAKSLGAAQEKLAKDADALDVALRAVVEPE
jgi:hypothetical protein